MKKTLTIVLILFVSLIFLVGCAKTGDVVVNIGTAPNDVAPKETIAVGAILALSGPSALWGQSVKNGMELAIEDHPEIKIIYEDSKGLAPDGISAYNKLSTQKIDVYVSALSSVAIPLASLTKEDKMPMIVTQSAANNLTNEYTFRYYSDADYFAKPSFDSVDTPLKNVTRIAVLYRNDYYATAVADKIKELSSQQGKEIVFFESYEPNTEDFSTQLTKIKNSKAQAFLYIPVPPSESLGILRKATELGFNIPIIEVSNVLSDPTTRAQAPNVTFYTEQFEFSMPGHSEGFKQRYIAKYGVEPNFVAAFGFDIVNLISTCKKDKIKECLENKKSITGVTGTVANITNNDILMPMYLLKVN